MEPEKPVGWTPPCLFFDYGKQARAVTQADVDRWVGIEHRYDRLMHDLKQALELADE